MGVWKCILWYSLKVGKKCQTGTDPAIDATKFGWPVNVIGKASVSKAVEKLKVMVGTQLVILPKLLTYRISIADAFQLRCSFKEQNVSVRWIPHILTDDQKRVRVGTAKQLPKMFVKLNQSILKYCSWWRTMGSLFLTSKKNQKQNMAN